MKFLNELKELMVKYNIKLIKATSSNARFDLACDSFLTDFRFECIQYCDCRFNTLCKIELQISQMNYRNEKIYFSVEDCPVYNSLLEYTSDRNSNNCVLSAGISNDCEDVSGNLRYCQTQISNRIKE
jgi:hypothetical protein